jgi:hypothetical protein
MGTEGLIVQIQSREEILADKWVALALRPNRIMYRDLWDILWLNRNNVQLNPELVFQKLNDRKKSRSEFFKPLLARVDELENDPQHQRMFQQEMERFLFASDQRGLLADPGFWNLLVLQLKEQATPLCTKI